VPVLADDDVVALSLTSNPMPEQTWVEPANWPSKVSRRVMPFANRITMPAEASGRRNLVGRALIRRTWHTDLLPHLAGHFFPRHEVGGIVENAYFL
jgi:hypothetical protein